TMVSFVEQQIERPLNRGESRLNLRAREIEELPCHGERLLAPADPLLDRRTPGEKCRGDLLCAEATENVEDQRELCLLGKLRVAAGEHHPKLSVADRCRLERLIDRWRERPFALHVPRELRSEG